MKVTENRNSIPGKFPKLMVMQPESVIVLFTNSGTGIVLSTGNNCYPLGYLHNDWNMIFFTDYTGSITLEND